MTGMHIQFIVKLFWFVLKLGMLNPQLGSARREAMLATKEGLTKLESCLICSFEFCKRKG